MKNQQIISELNRAKVAFQQRAICTAMGIQPSPKDERELWAGYERWLEEQEAKDNERTN